MKKQTHKLINKVIDIVFWLCMTVTLWFVVQVFIFASFKIPSDSMEPGLITGDDRMDFLNKYWPIFVDETQKELQSFKEQLLILEKELDNADAFNEIFRIAHSVTGLTSVMGYKRMHRLMRKIHEIFFEICNIIERL